jgi:acyl-CoA synthetase (AMP-forming)/AMP-acid ligase II
VPGYDLRLLDEDGDQVPDGTPGTLCVRGASTATGYWCRYDTSRQVFQGEWLRTGDTYVRDADGWYSCLRHAQAQRHLGLAGRGRGPARRNRSRS